MAQLSTDELFTAQNGEFTVPLSNRDVNPPKSTHCNYSRYWNPPELSNGERISVDMIRISLTFQSNGGEALVNGYALRTVPCDTFTAYPPRIRSNGYYELMKFEYGDSSAIVGIGHYSNACKLDMHKGFIEFNPNKVGNDKRLGVLLHILGMYTTKATVKRYDLAHDLPHSRKSIRLSKDRRTYHLVQSEGLTEYLGMRDREGYVKVYDKQAEAGLDTPLTRIELTCKGEWTNDEIIKHYPQVTYYKHPTNVSNQTEVIGLLIADRVERGESVEEYLKLLNRKTRDKVREFQPNQITLPSGALEHVNILLQHWTGYFIKER